MLNQVKTFSWESTSKMKKESIKVMWFACANNLWFLSQKSSRQSLIFLSLFLTSPSFQRVINVSSISTRLLMSAQWKKSLFLMRRARRAKNVWKSRSHSSLKVLRRSYAALRLAFLLPWRSMMSFPSSVASPFVTKAVQSLLVRCWSTSLLKIPEERLLLQQEQRSRRPRWISQLVQRKTWSLTSKVARLTLARSILRSRRKERVHSSRVSMRTMKKRPLLLRSELITKLLARALGARRGSRERNSTQAMHLLKSSPSPPLKTSCTWVPHHPLHRSKRVPHLLLPSISEQQHKLLFWGRRRGSLSKSYKWRRLAWTQPQLLRLQIIMFPILYKQVLGFPRLNNSNTKSSERVESAPLIMLSNDYLYLLAKLIFLQY